VLSKIASTLSPFTLDLRKLGLSNRPDGTPFVYWQVARPGELLKVSDNLSKHFLPMIEEIERSFEREIPDLVIGLRDFPEKANRKYWSTDRLQTPKFISACSKKEKMPRNR
jgi:hypothetical protein